MIVIGILAGVKPIEESWRGRGRTRVLRLTVKRGALTIDTLQEVAGARASRVRQFLVKPGSDPEHEEVTISFGRLSHTSVDAIAAKLRQNADVVSVETSEG